MAISIAAMLRGGPPPAGPQAKERSEGRKRSVVHSGAGERAWRRIHQTLRPDESMNLISSVLGGSAPRTRNMMAQCGGSGGSANA